MKSIHLDFETRSIIDLIKAGADIYARHPSTEVVCMAYCFDDGPVTLWTPEDDAPLDLLASVEAGVLVEGYNVNFEWLIWNFTCRRLYGWSELPFSQTDCVMLRSFAMSLPGRLEKCAHALALDFSKDMDGHRKMLALSKPRMRRIKDPTQCTVCVGEGIFDREVCFECYGTGEFTAFYTMEEKPEHYLDTYAYCVKDVQVERAMSKKLFRLSDSEQQLRHLDHKINQRGIYLDVEMTKKLIALADMEVERLHEKMRTVSDNRIPSTNAVADIKRFLRHEGIHTKSIAKAKVYDILADKNTPDICRQILKIRQEAAKTSTKKLNTAMKGVADDGHMRGLLQFLGAKSTGRWAGRRFQPQNIKRPKLKQDQIEEIFEMLEGVTL